MRRAAQHFLSSRGFHCSRRCARPVQQLSPVALQRLLTGEPPESLENAQLVDVREPPELLELDWPTDHTGKPSMQLLPLSQFGQWSNDIPTLLDRSKPVVVGCKAGVRSMQLCSWLEQEGFEEIYNIR